MFPLVQTDLTTWQALPPSSVCGLPSYCTPSPGVVGGGTRCKGTADYCSRSKVLSFPRRWLRSPLPSCGVCK